MDIRHFTENTAGTDYFVGDLHGCYDLLIETLDNLRFCTGVDRLFCTGDLIDRGPDSVKCLGLLREPWFFSVRGNHDQFLLDGVGNGDKLMWTMNGGEWHYGHSASELQTMYDLVDKECPLAFEIPYKGYSVGVIHANVTRGTWGHFDGLRDIWDRNRVRVISGVIGDIKGIDVVVVGHNVVSKPKMVDNVLHIDTGAVFGNELTVLSIDEVLCYE